MRQFRIPATFMRGGTSNAIVFHARDLPKDHSQWDAIFLAAMGSPDGYARQLNGMGGGISSLSKVCIIGPSTRPDADIDYTFAQIGVKTASVGYDTNCGNMSSAMGPFAVDEGLLTIAGDDALVRIHNTNTGKIIHSRFPMDDGQAAVDGNFELKGVTGVGAPVHLAFQMPGGANTGKLLPTGNPVDVLNVPGIGTIQATLIDAATALVVVEAAAIGLHGNESPIALDEDKSLMARLQAIRQAGATLMGIPKSLTSPKVGFVAPPMDAVTLSGAEIKGGDGDLTARAVSLDNVHRALPLTGAMCNAVAARIKGTVQQRNTRPVSDSNADVRLMNPSGIIPVSAKVICENGAWVAKEVVAYRTQRRLFDGFVYVPASKVSNITQGPPFPPPRDR
jgi:2-methylaconitate cis-trans-isomerase PrpF